MLNVTVDRGSWLSGHLGRDLESTLLDKQGNMCCLGFACIAAGISKNVLLKQATPAALCINTSTKMPETLSRLLQYSAGLPLPSNSNITWELMDYNDHVDLDTDARENGIKVVGREAGIQFKFTGTYRTAHDMYFDEHEDL